MNTFRQLGIVILICLHGIFLRGNDNLSVLEEAAFSYSITEGEKEGFFERKIAFLKGEVSAQVATSINNTTAIDIDRPEVCLLSVNVSQNGCTDNGDGTFTTNYDVNVSWIDPPAEAIQIIVNGSIAQTIPSGSASPQTVSISLPADGIGQDTIISTFATTTSCVDTLIFKSLNPCPIDVATCAASTGCLGGNAFDDFNRNGIDDSNETGIQGIQVIVYDCQNVAVDTVWTDSDGDWTICSLTDGEAYRVEFDIPESIACWASPTHAGGDNGTDIQFLTAPACTKFGLSNPNDYSEADPYIIIPCFSDGEHDGGNSAEAAIVKLRESADGHDFSGTTKLAGFEAVTLATHNDVGAVYGVAWQPTKERYYLSAFHKRYVGFGPDGADAIYQYDLAGNKTGTINLDALLPGSNTTGGDVHDFTAAVGGPHPGEIYDLGTGDISFDAVGKRGFGDIELSEDNNTLYVVNLFDKKIYALDISSGIAANTTVIQSWDTPDETFAGRNRPFALASHQGKLWIGSVDENGTEAYVHSLLPTTNTFNLELAIPLDFDRQAFIGDAYVPSALSNWNAWATTSNVAYTGVPTSDPPEIGFPQPILSDIEFGDNGDMILGFRDRFGDQSGAGRFLNSAETEASFSISAGDILKACLQSGNFVLENDIGSCNGNSGDGMSGPGGTEFYSWDFYNYQDPWSPIKTSANDFTPGGYNSGGFHWETTQGALLQLKGKPYIITTAMDPYSDYSGGLLKLNNETGGREGVNIDSSDYVDLVGGYTLFDTGEFGSLDVGNISFGKANGLGDLEAASEAAPLEIGNYVWCDSLINGIQDACEEGISNVIVQLYDRNGVLVGQDTTVNGQYYFNQYNVDTTGISVNGAGIASPSVTPGWTGLNYSTQYFIVFGSSQFTTDEFIVGTDTFGITPMVNIGNNDNIDSDVDGNSLTSGSLGARPNGLPFIDMTTNATGSGDHQYDLGVTCAPLPLPCVCPTTYSLCWDESGFVEPPNDDLSNFPYSNTMTNIDGSGIDLTVTLFQPSRDGASDTDPQQSYVSPGTRCGCTFDDEFGDYLSCGEVFRNWARQEPTPDTVIMTFSEPIKLPVWGFGGFKTNQGAIENAVASFTFYDGPNATGNKVVSTLPSPGGRAQINTGDPLVAAINELQDKGGQETELYNGTYYYEGQDNDRGWTILDLGDAVIYSIMVVQYTVEDGLSPADYVPVAPASGNNSGYWASFDYQTCACRDYGDLPDLADGTTNHTDYETYDSTGGPSHVIIDGLFLGDTVDVDMDGFPDASALGDDNDGAVDDEDGVTIFPTLDVVPGGIIKLPLTMTNNTGDPAFLDAWIDWNGDGDFMDAGEMVQNIDNIGSGTISNTMTINVPLGAVTNTLVGFRVRYSNTDDMTPYGRVNSGEVEDYLIGIECPQIICVPPSIELKKD